MDHENCRILLSSLSEYVDGLLEAELCAEIEKHLCDCDNCRIVVDSLRKTIDLYHITGEQTTAPPNVRERLFHSLKLDEFLAK
jgi:anti-sigma factor RsiW